MNAPTRMPPVPPGRPQARFALRVASRLSEQSAALPHDLWERLRVAREQALALAASCARPSRRWPRPRRFRKAALRWGTTFWLVAPGLGAAVDAAGAGSGADPASAPPGRHPCCGRSRYRPAGRRPAARSLSRPRFRALPQATRTVTLRPHRHRPCHAASVVAALVWACAAWPTAPMLRRRRRRRPVAVNAGGPPWVSLTPAQQSALAPLKKEWPAIDAARKQKWLEIAARLPSMPSRRVSAHPGAHDRMGAHDPRRARTRPAAISGTARSAHRNGRRVGTPTWRCPPKSGAPWPQCDNRARANWRRPRAGRRAPGHAATASVQKNNMVTAPSTPGGQDRGADRGAGQAGRQHHLHLEDCRSPRTRRSVSRKSPPGATRSTAAPSAPAHA